MIQSMIATGIIVKNVACHPKFWTIVPPMAIPTTDPAANIELKIPIPIAILDIGNWSLMMPNAIGNIEMPIP